MTIKSIGSQMKTTNIPEVINFTENYISCLKHAHITETVFCTCDCYDLIGNFWLLVQVVA